MEPLLKNKDTIIISNLPYLFSDPKINDIVVFIVNKNTFIKRIKKIKDEKYFLEGDNKRDSLDSNKFGLISKNQILGKLIYKI